MVPSLSVALAVTVMFGATLRTAPAAGAVMLTVGGASTRNVIALDVVTAPSLSVARAVRL